MKNPGKVSAEVAASSATAPDRFEKLYKMLLDSIPSSVLLVDAHLHVVSVNRNFLLKSRMAEAQVLGQHLEEVFPTAIYQHMNLRQRVAGVFRTGAAIQGDRMVYRAPGLLSRTYYYSLIPFRWQGGVEHVMVLMDDVTEQIRLGEEVRRAERHLASVVESASDIVVSMDIQGRILTWNTSAVRITGYEESAVRNKSLSDLCRQGQRKALALFLEEVPYHQGHTAPIEVELDNREGHAIPISWVCSPMRDTDGRVVGLVAVGRDLTERHKFEAQLLQSEKLAALGVMAGGIAHEIRNPLAVVSSAAQLLLEKPLSQSLHLQCCEKIHRGVQRVARIVESLLRFARPSGKGTMKTLDLLDVVDDALVIVTNQLKLAKIDLQTRFPESPLLIRGNASLLQQLVTNLLLNAANAMPENGGTIELSLENYANRVLLKVIDTGKGIPRGDLPKVFDPFFTTMPVGKGTGLGLSISYAIVRQHEGTIEVVSAERKGTTVIVSLPLEEGEERA